MCTSFLIGAFFLSPPSGVRPCGCAPQRAGRSPRAGGREKRRAAAHPRAAGTRPGSPDGPAPGSAAARPGERSAPRRDVPRDAEAVRGRASRPIGRRWGGCA